MHWLLALGALFVISCMVSTPESDARMKPIMDKWIKRYFVFAMIVLALFIGIGLLYPAPY